MRGPFPCIALAVALAGTAPCSGGCRPQAAGTPPLLYRSALLAYRLPQPLSFPPLAVPASPRAGDGQSPIGRAPTELAQVRAHVVEAARAEQPARDARPADVAGAGTEGNRPAAASGALIARAYGKAAWPLAAAGHDLGVRGLWQIAERDAALRGPRAPLPADVAFFHQTRDANGNGRLDDPLTEVALVERVDADGTVHLLYVLHGEVRPLVANPRHPHQRQLRGKVVNSYLRPARRGESKRTPHLAGEMLAGFATLIR